MILGLYDEVGNLVDTETASVGHDAHLSEFFYICGPHYVSVINGNPLVAHYSIEIKTLV